MWRELICEAAFAASDDGEIPLYIFADPADELSIARLETGLGAPFPEDLTSFLRETNGLKVVYEGGIEVDFFYSAHRIIEQNRLLRSPGYDCYLPFDHLIAFVELGNGDFYAYGRTVSGELSPGIFLWDHETDSRIRQYSDLEELIRRFNKP